MRRPKGIMLIVICLFIFWSASIIAESKIINNNTIVFKNVNIIPMNKKGILKNRSVIIKDEIIQKITSKGNLNINKEAYVIDATGKYLMPGLSDMHVHIRNKSDLKLFLANGITTVRNMAGHKTHLIYKKKINNGEIIGPNIITTTPLLDGNPPIYPHADVLSNTKVARETVREYKEKGYDYIKVYEKLNKEVYDAIIEEAKRQNIEVVGHVPDKVGIRNVISSGQVSIEVGKKTDIVLLNKNPLKDIKNTKSIEGVLIRGKWLNKSFIQHMLEEIPQDWW
ncbi:MAG: hypothetical protein R6V14_02035 [Halanaerobiales bacterium]